MAVIQTPRGLVVGLVIPKDDQPQHEGNAEQHEEGNTVAKRPGRPPKK